jgi:hypothetical protein
MLVEEILEEMKKRDVEDVLKKYDWRSFESFVEFVFQQHEFETRRNFRFFAGKRYEIDVLAEREAIVCVECKRWKGWHKKASLIEAARKHEEKVKEFIKAVKPKKHVMPVLIALTDEGIVKEGYVYIIPVWKLNEFLLNFEMWINSEL